MSFNILQISCICELSHIYLITRRERCTFVFRQKGLCKNRNDNGIFEPQKCYAIGKQLHVYKSILNQKSTHDSLDFQRSMYLETSLR